MASIGHRLETRAGRRSGARGRLAGSLVVLGVLALAGCGSGTKTTSSVTAAPATTATTATSSTTSDSSSSSGSSSSGSGSVAIGDGVSITPASGWTVVDQKQGNVSLANSDKTVFYFASVGRATANSAVAQLQADIKLDSDPANGNQDYRDVQLQDNPTNDPPPNTTKFDQGASADFTATDSNGNQVTGLYGELYNSSTQNSVFISTWSSDSNALDQAQSDLKAMNASLVG